jgi:hypothetical protein
MKLTKLRNRSGGRGRSRGGHRCRRAESDPGKQSQPGPVWEQLDHGLVPKRSHRQPRPEQAAPQLMSISRPLQAADPCRPRRGPSRPLRPSSHGRSAGLDLRP